MTQAEKTSTKVVKSDKKKEKPADKKKEKISTMSCQAPKTETFMSSCPVATMAAPERPGLAQKASVHEGCFYARLTRRRRGSQQPPPEFEQSRFG